MICRENLYTSLSKCNMILKARKLAQCWKEGQDHLKQEFDWWGFLRAEDFGLKLLLAGTFCWYSTCSNLCNFVGKTCIVSWKWQYILVSVEKLRAKNRTKIPLLVINCCWSLKQQQQQQQQRTGQHTWIKIRKKHLKPECTYIRCESMNIHPSRVTGGWSQMRCGVHPGPQCIAELTYRGTVTHLQAINLTCVSPDRGRQPGTLVGTHADPCRTFILHEAPRIYRNIYHIKWLIWLTWSGWWWTVNVCVGFIGARKWTS